MGWRVSGWCYGFYGATAPTLLGRCQGQSNCRRSSLCQADATWHTFGMEMNLRHSGPKNTRGQVQGPTKKRVSTA